MHPDFWLKSWETGATSFHRKDVHPYITTYATPDVLRGKRVLVPLCGKTNDLMWFREYGEHVVGVELAEQGIVQFFEEQQLPYRKVSATRYEAEGITMLQRDFFELTSDDVGRIDYVYDRAALVALPVDGMRQRYLDKVDELMEVGAQAMVITLEYAPLMAEPPFSITPEETCGYYRANYTIAHVESPEVPDHRMIPKFGLSFLKEHCFIVTKQFHRQRLLARELGGMEQYEYELIAA